MRQGNQALDQTKFSQERSITEQLMLIQNLKRELKDKELLIQKTQAHADNLSEQNAQLSETNNMLKANVAKLEAKVESTKDEIGKGNQII